MTIAFLGALLLAQGQGASGGVPWRPRSLSAFEAAKAEALLRNRLPCLGCHELGGEGGRVGPTLSELKRSRAPAHVYSKILDPQAGAPGSIMPLVPMAPATRDLIASYLTQREPSRPARPSGPLPPPDPVAGATGAAALYQRHCATCHGVQGGGDGPNARFLPVRPTVHADAAHMSRRSDDALFDTIHAGGYIMNLSARMPPYGDTLTRDQIWALVRHLRSLCRCEGPTWSRDGR